MLLERTISQLDIGPVTPSRAVDLGQMGFVQWLGALPGGANYAVQARRALAQAAPFCAVSPAVMVFCDLVIASLAMPPRPLDLPWPRPQRRGGARARRAGA